MFGMLLGLSVFMVASVNVAAMKQQGLWDSWKKIDNISLTLGVIGTLGLAVFVTSLAQTLK
jgi:hypothetical protein